MARLFLAASILWLGTVSACGSLAAAPVAAPTRPQVLPEPVATPVSHARGAALLADFRQQLSRAKGLDTELTSSGEGTWDDGVDQGVRRTHRNRARLEWRKPNRMHGTMLEAPFALMVGGTLDTADGVTLTLRPKGLLSVVSLQVSSTDVKLRNSRNHPFRDSHPAAQLTRLSATTADWTVASESAETLSLEVTGVRRLDAGIEREVLVLAKSDLAPRSLAMFTGGRQVVLNTFKGFRWR